MLTVLQAAAILLVAAAMALALAHALELPGKLRLTKDEYFIVQAIYYPGFTIAGLSEPVGLLAILVLLFFLPAGSLAFWLTLAAFVVLLTMHAAYWVLTHPVNSFWVPGFRPSRLGSTFFGFDPLGRRRAMDSPDWTVLRYRWEFSHVVRGILGLVGLALLVVAATA
jgi:hypothetical protein